MSTHQFDVSAAPVSRLAVPRHTSIAEQVTPELVSRDPVRQADLSASPPPPRVQAAALARSAGGHLSRTGNALLQLQHLHGNRYVQQVLGHFRRGPNPRAPVIQPKLVVGPADDRYERAADQVAEQVMRRPARSAPDTGVSAGCPPAGARLSSAAGGVVEGPVARAIQQARAGGQPVPGEVRERMERALGADFRHVRIHTDARSDRLNDALRSRAFTVGADVFVGRGQYRPGTPAGDELLAHELTHTVQQGAVRALGSAAGPVAHGPGPGCRAVAGPVVVQRKLFRLGGTKTKPSQERVRWAEVKSEPAVIQAEDIVALVIEEVSYSSAIDLEFTDVDDLVRQAARLAAKPSRKLFTDVEYRTCELLLAHWRDNGKDYEALRPEIDRRRARHARRRVRASSGPRLHTPQHDPHYKVTKGWDDKPADVTGRKDSKWRPTKNTSGLIPAATTGSVNLELLTEQETIGNVVKVGDFHVQICPGCASAEFVESFEVDHQNAFSAIRDQFFALAEQLDSDSAAEKGFRKELGSKLFNTYFTTKTGGTKKKSSTKIVPSKAAMSIFSNDLDNLMRICRRCNGATGKSDLHYLDWYLRNDLFGPQFIRENLIDDSGHLLPRAKHGKGWGVAARDWFEQHHLEVLKKLFAARELQEETRSSLVRESSSRIRSRSVRDPKLKRKWEDETEQLSLRNTRTVGLTKLVTTAHTSSDLPRIRLGSPERDLTEISEVIKTQETSRKQRRMAETTPYTDGYDDGYGGKPDRSQQYLTGASDAYRAYRQGSTDGAKDAQIERGLGYTDAVTTGRTRGPGSSGPYDSGFAEGSRRVARVQAQGEADGKSRTLPSDTIVNPTEVGAGYLFQVYLKAYRTGSAS